MKKPVCELEVPPDRAAEEVEHEGDTYYFCSERRRNKFLENFRVYLSEQKNSTTLDARNYQREYTCPMHPEVVQLGPGSYPGSRETV